MCFWASRCAPIIKGRQWKLLAVYGVIFLTAYVFSILTEMQIKLPSPAEPIKRLITAIVGLQG
jgi:hypothetical protein